MTEEPEPVGAPKTMKLPVHYIKSSAFKEFACHGAIGGPTPAGKIFFALYSERAALPRLLEYDVPVPEGDKIEFDERSAIPTFIDSRQGFIRVMESGYYMDIDAAERLAGWITLQVQAAREA